MNRPTRPRRDPESTRAAILEAAKRVLAREGREGLSVSAVAKQAGVDRGTVHRHFQGKEELLRATLDWVGRQLLQAVYGPEEAPFGGRIEGPLTQAHLPRVIRGMAEFNVRLAEFAVDNPEIGRIWLFDVLSRENPQEDAFYHRFLRGLEQLAASEVAERNIDVEVLAVLMLTAYFMWPVWVGAHAKGPRARRQMARRFAGEVLRLSMHGVLRADSHALLQDYVRRNLAP
ncbi:MAG: hypothetical protein KatS3mg124_1778 [Porticoccaceae bacterium]|nr:MAG: hypothetical protein KatS3mg124_1778 [Porticoccaceae bacterium]